MDVVVVEIGIFEWGHQQVEVAGHEMPIGGIIQSKRKIPQQKLKRGVDWQE